MCGVWCALPEATACTSTGAACCSSMMHLGEFTSHSRTVWSYDPVTSSFGELGLRAPQRTKSVWPSNLLTCVSAATSQQMARWSSDAVNTFEPSGVNRATCTARW